MRLRTPCTTQSAGVFMACGLQNNKEGYAHAMKHIEDQMAKSEVVLGDNRYAVKKVYDLTWNDIGDSPIPIFGKSTGLLKNIFKVNVIVLENTDVNTPLAVVEGFDLNKCQVGFDIGSPLASFDSIKFVTSEAHAAPLHFTAKAFSVPKFTGVVANTTRNSAIKGAVKKQVQRYQKYSQRFPLE